MYDNDVYFWNIQEQKKITQTKNKPHKRKLKKKTNLINISWLTLNRIDRRNSYQTKPHSLAKRVSSSPLLHPSVEREILLRDRRKIQTFNHGFIDKPPHHQPPLRFLHRPPPIPISNRIKLHQSLLLSNP